MRQKCPKCSENESLKCIPAWRSRVPAHRI